MRLETDPAERDKINEKIRQLRLPAAMGKANEAMAAGVWDEARAAYENARKFVRPDDTVTLETIKSKVDEIDVQKQYHKMLLDGDKAFRDANYDLAKTLFKALKKYAQDLQSVLDGGAPAAAPAPRKGKGPAPDVVAPPVQKVAKKLIDEIRTTADARLKEVDFATYMLSARSDLDRGQLDSAEAWVNQALGIKPEDRGATDLLATIKTRRAAKSTG